MIEKIRQNLALVVGLAIPFILVCIIAGMVYVPKLFSQKMVPAYDFVYAVGGNVIYPAQLSYMAYPSNPCSPFYYTIENGLLVKKPNAQPVDNTQYCKGQPVVDVLPEFYRHNTLTNVSTKITFDEASTLLFATGVKSPDGFEVVHGGGSGEFFPFFGGGSDYLTLYLKKGSYVEKLDMQISSERYYGDNTLGWVLRK
jgi:hypothetical protein